MRVAITGASGNVGTSVLAALASEQRIDSIVAIARRKPADQGDGVEWRTADVARDPLQPLFDGVDAVIHLAWAIQPSHDEAATFATNVTGSARVFEAAAAAGVGALVYASSIGAYSPRSQELAPVDESWRTGGIASSFYSRHKAAVEAELDRFEQRHPNVRVVRLRPALIFKGSAGSEIRRLFAGPFVPRSLLAPGRLPVVPWISGLRTQAVHSHDVGDAYRLATLGDARGAFNIAADPVLDEDAIASALDARVLQLPGDVVRAAAAASWRLRLQPSPPGWVDMARRVPLMDTSRARRELGWRPEQSAGDAVREVLAGMSAGSGAATPPLEAKAGGPLRIREILTRVGGRDRVGS